MVLPQRNGSKRCRQNGKQCRHWSVDFFKVSLNCIYNVYCKNQKNSDTQKTAVITLKFEKVALCRIMYPKIADGMANSVGLDQTAPLIWVYTICSVLPVRKGVGSWTCRTGLVNRQKIKVSERKWDSTSLSAELSTFMNSTYSSVLILFSCVIVC